MKTGEQFEDGKIGFAQSSSNGSKGTVGADPTDELETKIAGVDALEANGLSSDNLTGKNSKAIMKAYENTREKDGSLSPENKSAVLDVMFTTKYKEHFDKKGMGKNSVQSAAEGAAKADKGDKTVRRENGKTIKTR